PVGVAIFTGSASRVPRSSSTKIPCVALRIRSGWPPSWKDALCISHSSLVRKCRCLPRKRSPTPPICAEHLPTRDDFAHYLKVGFGGEHTDSNQRLMYTWACASPQ